MKHGEAADLDENGSLERRRQNVSERLEVAEATQEGGRIPA